MRTESEVCTHADAARVEAVDYDSFNEVVSSHARPTLVERNKRDTTNPECLKLAQLGPTVAKQAKSWSRSQYMHGMGVEGKDGVATDQHLTVPEVNSVECTYGYAGLPTVVTCKSCRSGSFRDGHFQIQNLHAYPLRVGRMRSTVHSRPLADWKVCPPPVSAM
ncbi:hypothetical protein R1CP_38970 (plasmid) [Rhodococcus opacus]|uniref:Uncharacterized protein n=1 Tax=Rhodococcus opacus TaxID=37919 RepID=A0A1B1KIE2_RHOOP|nr:hypothetical protein R1CP_38465 [Rhodococcus opacus]ANS32382.1 hypothetical protein R1CP_38970 [Rhodococcus opacus]